MVEQAIRNQDDIIALAAAGIPLRIQQHGLVATAIKVENRRQSRQIGERARARLIDLELVQGDELRGVLAAALVDVYPKLSVEDADIAPVRCAADDRRNGVQQERIRVRLRLVIQRQRRSIRIETRFSGSVLHHEEGIEHTRAGRNRRRRVREYRAIDLRSRTLIGDVYCTGDAVGEGRGRHDA